jgi:hypothetical protein
MRRKWLWDKTKTVYSFDMNRFCEALEQADEDGLHAHVENEIYRAAGKVVGSSHAYQVRSGCIGQTICC